MVNKKIKKTVTDWEKWKNIHQDFSEETVGLWKDKNFTYEQAEKWVKAFRKDFSPSNIDYFEWIKNIRRPTPFQLINRRNLEKLPEEFKEYQKGLKTTKVFPEEEENSEEIIFERESDQEDLTPLDLKEQLEIEKSKTQKIGRQRKISLIENEKISGQLAEKEEEIASLKLELSKSRNSQKKLEKQLAEKEKLLKDSEEKLEELTNQSKEEKLKLVASQSTRIKEGIDKKKIIEEKLANFETELSRTRGNYETQIVKLRAEKLVAEKQNAVNLQLLNTAQSKIEELTRYRGGNEKSTRHFRNQSSSSSNSRIATDNDSDASSISPKNTRSFRNAIRKRAGKFIPIINSPKKQKSLAQELNIDAYGESDAETSESSPFSENFPSPRDDSFTSYATTPDVSDTESSVKLETEETIKAAPDKGKNNNDEGITNYYKSITQKYEHAEQELAAAREEIQELKEKNAHQSNIINEKEEEIKKLKLSGENKNLRRTSSLTNLDFLNKFSTKTSKQKLTDEFLILKAENEFITNEKSKAEYIASRNEEIAKEIKNNFSEEEKKTQEILKDWEHEYGVAGSSGAVMVGKKFDDGRFEESDPSERTYIKIIGTNEEKRAELIEIFDFLNELRAEHQLPDNKQTLGWIKNELKDVREKAQQNQTDFLHDKEATLNYFSSPNYFESVDKRLINKNEKILTDLQQEEKIEKLKADLKEANKFKEEQEKERKQEKEQISDYLEKQVFSINELEKQRESLYSLIDKNKELSEKEKEQEKELAFQTTGKSRERLLQENNTKKITTLLGEINEKLEETKNNWQELRDSFELESFPLDWEEACAVFLTENEVDKEAYLSGDEDCLDINPELLANLKKTKRLSKELLQKTPDNLISVNTGHEKSIEELKEKNNQIFTETDKSIRNEFAKLNEAINSHEKENKIQEAKWKFVFLLFELEDEIVELGFKKTLDETTVKSLEKLRVDLKNEAEKLGIKGEELDEIIIELINKNITDQNLCYKLLKYYNSYYSHEKTYDEEPEENKFGQVEISTNNKEEEIIKKIINDLGLKLEQDSSLNEVIEFIKELISPPTAIAKDKENGTNSEEIKSECDEEKSVSEDEEESEEMSDEDIEELIDKVRQLKKVISKLENQNNEDGRKKNELLKELDNLRKERDGFLTLNRVYEGEITKLEKEIKERQKYQTKEQEFETKIEIVKQFLPKEQ